MNQNNFKDISWDEILANNERIDLILSKSQITYFLDKVGYSIDNDSYIIYKKNENRVLDVKNNEMKINEFGALMSSPDGPVFVKNDIVNYAHYLAKYPK